MTSPWSFFEHEIRGAELKIGSPEVVWYRGHSSDRYTLIPSLHRYPNGLAVERQLFEDYIEIGGPKYAAKEYVEGPNVQDAGPALDADWKALFDMQHFGIPTRLLDWTESLAVAVAFAILDRENSFNGPASVFVLNPVELNKCAGQPGLKTIKGAFKYKSLYWDHDPVTVEKPLALSLPKDYYNDRMNGQRAAFTVHGEDGRALDAICPDVATKVPLPCEAFEAGMEFLTTNNVNHYTIFPDIVGMAKYIRRKWLQL